MAPADADDDDPLRGELEVAPTVRLSLRWRVMPAAVQLDHEPSTSEGAIDSTVRAFDAERHLALRLLDPFGATCADEQVFELALCRHVPLADVIEQPAHQRG